MEKNLQAGVKSVAILKIVFGILFLVWVGGMTLGATGSSRVPLSVKLSGIFMSMFILGYILNAFFLSMLGMNARRTSVLLDIIAIIIDSTVLIPGILKDIRYGGWHMSFYAFHLPIVILFISFIIYLTRPRVKGQFK